MKGSFIHLAISASGNSWDISLIPNGSSYVSVSGARAGEMASEGEHMLHSRRSEFGSDAGIIMYTCNISTLGRRDRRIL